MHTLYRTFSQHLTVSKGGPTLRNQPPVILDADPFAITIPVATYRE